MYFIGQNKVGQNQDYSFENHNTFSDKINFCPNDAITSNMSDFSFVR